MSSNFICTKFGTEFSTLEAIAWNTESHGATLKTTTGDELKGKVIATKDHNGGKSVNILFKHETPYYGADKTEFIVFPVQSTYRAIGVTYTEVDNLTLLNTFQGNTELSCMALSE